MPPGPVWIFSPLEYKYRNHVAPSACSSNSSTVAARRTCVECFTSVRRQCGLPFSCLLHNQLHYVQRTDTAGPVESLTASPKRTGYCKQAGGVMTDARNAVNCLSERKHKREGRHPNVVRCNSKSVFASAIFLTVIRSTWLVMLFTLIVTAAGNVTEQWLRNKTADTSNFRCLIRRHVSTWCHQANRCNRRHNREYKSLAFWELRCQFHKPVSRFILCMV